MKNNVNKQIEKNHFVKNGSICSFCLLAGLLASQQGQAQFYNKGEVSVAENTILSIYENYDNTSDGDFVNDGNVYIYKNWNNDGKVGFTSTKSGKTFFEGEVVQTLTGDSQSNFQNVKFNNISDVIAFNLNTKISVNAISEFENGIVLADASTARKGLVIFQKDAVHEKTSDLSFVDGEVQKIGVKAFEFPVGDYLYFRPSMHADARNMRNVNNTYTTQYFYKNSDDIQHPHSQKEAGIQLINNAEYWNVTKEKESDNIILTLTLDPKTTPADFFNVSSDKKVVIVRWDGTKWVNEGGAVRNRDSSDPISAATYTQVITSEVKGFGMFTIALVDNENDEDLIVYNAVSPNNDGINDTFHIKGIDKYPDNEVEIFNRWGVKVYSAKSYNETDVMFGGYSDGRATINRGDKLPTGTYFYILKYNTGKQVKEKAGYLYINNQ